LVFTFKGLSAQTNLGNSLRYAYLYEGLVSICKSNQPIQSQQPATSSSLNLKSLLLNHNNSKFKQSGRHVFLFDGLLIFTKKLPAVSAISTLSNITSPATLMSPSNVRNYRFKQVITLDKCLLRDRDDDFCFELHVCNSISYQNFNQQQQQSQQISAQSSQDQVSSPNQLNSPNAFQSNCSQLANQECILFMTNTVNEKYQWMSMLCYSQYKFTIDRLLQTMTEEHNRNNPLPIPPKGYIFDQPDTPDTILFDNQSKEDAVGSNSGSTSSMYSARSMMLMADSLSIRAATMVKLVERLTHHLYLHPKFSSTFLMFFRGFSTPKELLCLLSQRYDVPDLNINELDNKYNFNR
jgi:hypothetical protein